MHKQKSKFFLKSMVSIIVLLATIQQSATFAKTILHNNHVTFARQKFKISKGGIIALDTTGGIIIGVSDPGLGIAFGISELAIAAGAGVKYIQDLKVNFIEDAHCVHSGQPYKGVLSNNSSGLSVLAGRKDSKYVAECFNNWVQGGGSTFGHSPSALNFAVKGTLQVTVPEKKDNKVTNKVYTFKNIVLAQGRSGSTNNWWIGSANCTHKDHGRIACKPEGYNTDVCFNRPQGSISTIHLVSCKRTY